ncbi:MAG TPA: hypothetical protein VMH39_16520, partial [Gemmatimonadaceae bacterium]|nr:hypothetical protein [Gemmatimonadaceae bacterium]
MQQAVGPAMHPPPQVTARPAEAWAEPPPAAHTNGFEHSNGLAERVEAAHAGTPHAAAPRGEARQPEPPPAREAAPVADDANDDRLYEAKTLPIGAVPAVVLERIAAKASGNAEAAEPAAAEESAPAGPELPALPLHRGLGAGPSARRMIERVATAAREWQRHPFEGELPPWFLWASTGAGMAVGAGAA